MIQLQDALFSLEQIDSGISSLLPGIQGNGVDDIYAKLIKPRHVAAEARVAIRSALVEIRQPQLQEGRSISVTISIP